MLVSCDLHYVPDRSTTATPQPAGEAGSEEGIQSTKGKAKAGSGRRKNDETEPVPLVKKQEVLAAALLYEEESPKCTGGQVALDHIRRKLRPRLLSLGSLVHGFRVQIKPKIMRGGAVPHRLPRVPSAQTHAAIQRDSSAVETLYGAPDASLALPGVAVALANRDHTFSCTVEGTGHWLRVNKGRAQVRLAGPERMWPPRLRAIP